MDLSVLADLHRVGAEIAAWELRTGRRLPAGSLLLATCTATLSPPPPGGGIALSTSKD